MGALRFPGRARQYVAPIALPKVPSDPPSPLSCSPPAARGACGPRSQQMALFGSAALESLGITSRLCRP